MGYYRTAQICLNGHLITDSADAYSELQEKFCSKCGSKTIMACQHCNSKIRGDYYVEGVWGVSDYDIPAYCHNCGKPYPWTQAAIESAALLINEDENLNSDEKQQFRETLPDLIVQSPTPRTQVAVVRFKKFISKTASYTADGIKDIFVDVASETIKKSLGL